MRFAALMELVDMQVLGTCGETRASSSLAGGTSCCLAGARALAS